MTVLAARRQTRLPRSQQRARLSRRTLATKLLMRGIFVAFLVDLYRSQITAVDKAITRKMLAYGKPWASASDLGHYRSQEELEGRALRFPTVDKRVKVYMSTWYVPPCIGNKDGMIQFNSVYPLSSSYTASSRAITLKEPATINNERNTLLLNATIEHSRNIFFLDRQTMNQCHDKFCMDTVKYFFPSLDRVSVGDMDDVPIIMQFGDAEQYTAFVPSLGKNTAKPSVPVIKKFRYSMDKQDLERVTSQTCYSGQRELAGTLRNREPGEQAIISIVSNYMRHFDPLNEVQARDTPWDQKRDAAVFRGALTGRNKALGNVRRRSEYEWCGQIPRCNFVLKHGNSTLVDARLVSLKRNELTATMFQNVEMFGESFSMEEMLRYKVVVMLEGNDVSSGLKWALFSDSVVMTQKPTCTSWALEELLEPWVHYIPISDDFSDVEEKVQWVLDNDAKAREIARRGRLWMTDLVYHPDATKDNESVLDETFRRYRAHFSHNPDLIVDTGLPLANVQAEA